jgi:hypothetical protein
MISRLIAEMDEEGLLLRQGKQFILLEVFAGEKSDSQSHKKPTDSKASPELPSQPTVIRPFRNSGAERNGRLPAAPVVPASLSKRGPKGLRV